ncbi:MAG: methyltransferase domain-containing protein [Armatimonadetes bacterium]|nr:methyltransferase domain-containing protein [Armatimonadota bacterium]MDE2207790.1 methyltransferase domain-containing protein [Armatimonadota bacterium]
MSEVGTGSIVDPMYTTGKFYTESKGARDAAFKIAELRKLIGPLCGKYNFRFNRAADIGCDTGQTTFLLRDMLRDLGFPQAQAVGYDLHPHVNEIQGDDSTRFIQGDFCATKEATFDLAILLDVIEHVPAPADFMRQVANKARWVALHIPLDNTWLNSLRNQSAKKLDYPGHLVILDIPSAINLVTLSGLRVVAYNIDPAFRAPSGRATKMLKLMYPLRQLLHAISPFLLQRTLGGVCLTVLARSPIDMEAGQASAASG